MSRNDLFVFSILAFVSLAAIGFGIWSPSSFDPIDPHLLVRPFRHILGNSYLANVAVRGIPADEEGRMDQSTLQLYEGDRPLGPQHVSSDQIAMEGRGTYLYWQTDNGKVIIFSTSDNTDPNTNERTYRVLEIDAQPREKN
ncbi:hypothetical protein JQ615_40880 [Bradyrhizobium jicamae]|uniref:Uncharacterized protein n=1 Tax=Bradyrhizobium jicamae TaxID=280332 RepID=A0ABS5FY28_9BRAD|nr:hypothetical protein [Bradyrhizobium jicamae]MBR0801703.1 hypothetical protein [Bradyrhizobium jicamae]